MDLTEGAGKEGLPIAEVGRFLLVAVAPSTGPLCLEPAVCCSCGETDASVPVAVGDDFEYRTSADQFVMFRCRRCGLLYLNPRPAKSEFARIYGGAYHAYQFTEERFGLSYRIRERLETRRLRGQLSGLPRGARIIDIGAGDGFHLGLISRLGDPSWALEAVEPDQRAAESIAASGFVVHTGFLEDLSLEPASYDLALMIMTLEHLADPRFVLEATRDLLRPGGRLLIVTDNIDSPDAAIGRNRHWGGYHFPRHFYLFSRRSLALLSRQAGFEVDGIDTVMSPVNWTYTVRNLLDDWGAPGWMVNRFTLQSPGALAVFTVVDLLAGLLGRGALLRAILRRPEAGR
jgi:SAM-dependent methyltransferase